MQKTANLYEEIVDAGGRDVDVVIADMYVDGEIYDSRVFSTVADAEAAMLEAGYETEVRT